MTKIRYPNSVAFKKALAGMHKEFDYEASIRLHRDHFATKDGKVYRGRAAAEMWRMLNGVFGDFIDVSRSIKLRTKYTITFLQEPVICEEEDDDETPTNEGEEPLEEVSEQEPEAEAFDKAYAESLYNEGDKGGSKDALEAYGKKFGIDLKKNKSFPNMIKDLVEHTSK